MRPPRLNPSLISKRVAKLFKNVKDRPLVLIGNPDAVIAYVQKHGIDTPVHVLTNPLGVHGLDPALPWKIIEVYGAHEPECVAARKLLELRMMTRYSARKPKLRLKKAS